MSRLLGRVGARHRTRSGRFAPARSAVGRLGSEAALIGAGLVVTTAWRLGERGTD